MKKQFSIYDIAKELGISPSTVSKAINGNKNISEKTREKVQSYVKEHGYTPNIVASSLKNKISLSIGVAYPTTTKNVMTHFFFSHVIESFRNYVEKSGYEFCYVSHYLGQYEVPYSTYIHQRNLDGVLILGATAKDTEIMDILSCECKLVSIDYLDKKVPFIQTDDKMGARLIIENLKKNDLLDIAYVSGPYNLGEFEKRTRIFCEELFNNKIILDKKNIIEIDGTDFKAGYDGVIKLINKLKRNPKVIVASNDEIAYGVIRGLESLNIKVPKDISVIGFDDMYFSQYFTPSLSTIRQHCEEIGEIAGKILIDSIAGKPIQKENYVPCELIIRESSKN